MEELLSDDEITEADEDDDKEQIDEADDDDDEDVNEEFTYNLEVCTRTYDVQTTYMNANGISNSVLTQTDQIEANIPDAICCEESAASADDPLIEACKSDGA